MTALQYSFNMLEDFLKGVSDVWKWLTTPIGIGDFSMPPIAFIGGAGLLVLLGWLLVHFLNPAN